MTLGDAFSRNPEHRVSLLEALEARTGDLRQMHAVLKGFDIDELRTSEPWEEGFRPPPHKEITASWPGVVKVATENAEGDGSNQVTMAEARKACSSLPEAAQHALSELRRRVALDELRHPTVAENARQASSASRVIGRVVC